MKLNRNALTAWVVACAVLLAASGCGYILHPERRTQPLSSEKDGTVIIYDCLWLLAGVIPGVVALVVDGINDTWYYTEAELAELQATGRIESTATRGSELAVRLHGKAPADAIVTLVLTDDEGRPLAETIAAADPGQDRQQVSLLVPGDVDVSEATLALAVDGDTQLTWHVTITD